MPFRVRPIKERINNIEPVRIHFDKQHQSLVLLSKRVTKICTPTSVADTNTKVKISESTRLMHNYQRWVYQNIHSS